MGQRGGPADRVRNVGTIGTKVFDVAKDLGTIVRNVGTIQTMPRTTEKEFGACPDLRHDAEGPLPDRPKLRSNGEEP